MQYSLKPSERKNDMFHIPLLSSQLVVYIRQKLLEKKS